MHLHLYSSRRPAAASLLPPFLPLAPRERSVGRAKAAGTPKRAAAAAERARGEEVAADNKQRMKRAREGGRGGRGTTLGNGERRVEEGCTRRERKAEFVASAHGAREKIGTGGKRTTETTTATRIDSEAR